MSNTGNGSASSTLRNPLVLIGVGILAFLIVFSLVWYGIGQSVQSSGNKQQATLSANYSDGANYLSNCVVKTNQAANVAQANADAFDKVIKDAIAGSGAFHTNTANSAGGLVPILVQAYPDLKGQTDLYNKVANIIVGCQDDFRNKQSVVLDNVRTFNSWLGGSWKVRHFGSSFPNNRLTINISGLGTLRGQQALDKISQPIVDASTSQAYNSGQQSTNGPFSTASPSTSK